MNTYYLVPSAEFQQTKRRGFDEITEGIVTNPQLDEYQRAVALQESLNKFLNMKPTYNKDRLQVMVKEVLSDMKPTTPQPKPKPQLQPKYHTPIKIPTIFGTFLSTPPPPVKHQTPYHTDDSDNEGDDDDDDDKPSPRAADLKASQQLQDMSKKKGGVWISKN